MDAAWPGVLGGLAGRGDVKLASLLMKRRLTSGDDILRFFINCLHPGWVLHVLA